MHFLHVVSLLGRLQACVKLAFYMENKLKHQFEVFKASKFNWCTEPALVMPIDAHFDQSSLRGYFIISAALGIAG